MATREEITIANDLIRYINNCQRDMVRNAGSYLAEIAGGHQRLTTAQLGQIVNADGAAIQSADGSAGEFRY